MRKECLEIVDAIDQVLQYLVVALCEQRIKRAGFAAALKKVDSAGAKRRRQPKP
jgi:hypothetical protein